MRGRYGDADGNCVTEFSENFLNLDDEELHKYLEIAKKLFSGKTGNNLLNLEFAGAAGHTAGAQQGLLSLRDSGLTDDAVCDAFFENATAGYDAEGNRLILLFHDVYDVPSKSEDGADLDDSEEAYEYVLCAVCPVTLAKPALGYKEDENRIGARARDWIVGPPDTGFLFPAFNDRSADIHSMLFYTKNAAQPHTEFMTGMLGCREVFTATQKKALFDGILSDALGEGNDAENAKIFIHGGLHETADSPEETGEEPHPMDTSELSAVLDEAGVEGHAKDTILKQFASVFSDDPPQAGQIYDIRLAEECAARKERIMLLAQIEALKGQIDALKGGHG